MPAVAYASVLGGLLDIEDANDARFLGRLLLALGVDVNGAKALIEKVRAEAVAPLDARTLAAGIIAAIEERRRSGAASVPSMTLALALDAHAERNLFGKAFKRRVRETTRAGLAAKKARGEMRGRLRFGFRGIPTGRRTQRGTPCLREVPDAAEQKTIRRMTKMRAGGSTYREIASALNADGVPTQRGEPWQVMTIWRILKREGREGNDNGQRAVSRQGC